MSSFVRRRTDATVHPRAPQRAAASIVSNVSRAPDRTKSGIGRTSGNGQPDRGEISEQQGVRRSSMTARPV